MAANVEFIFDFASPNAYLAHKALDGIVERIGATVTINPCLLGGIFKATGNQAPFMAYAKSATSSTTNGWNCSVSSTSTG